MKVKIFTLANVRPDFIEIQYDSIKKFVTDEVEYVVFNNARNDNKRFKLINEICQRLGVECIEVKGKYDKHNDPSVIVANSLNYLWKNYLYNEKDLLFYIDSDMFFVKKISVNDLMDGHNFAFVPNYRGKDFEVLYPWTGLMCFNMNTLPNPSELVWDAGSVLGYGVDVGGLNHYYLKKYEEDIKILYLEMWNLQEVEHNEEGEKIVTCNLNGNIKFLLKFSPLGRLIDVDTTDHFISNTRSFPYQQERPDYYSEIASNFTKFEAFLDNKNITFPKPYYIDLFKTNGAKFEDCFIFHYKSGSNWLDFQTDEYNEKKTQQLHKLINQV